MREACMSTNHSEPRLQLIPLWLEHLAQPLPAASVSNGLENRALSAGIG